VIVRTFCIKTPKRYNYYHDIICSDCGKEVTVRNRTGIKELKEYFCNKCSHKRGGAKRGNRVQFECVSCHKVYILRKFQFIKKKTALCYNCYLNSPEKKVAGISTGDKLRNTTGKRNRNHHNYNGSTKDFMCKCGKAFEADTCASRIKAQGMPQFCSIVCNHRFSVSYQKVIEYNGIKYRSSWEVALAKYFDKKGIAFQYEPKSFETPYGFYTPDFYVPAENVYYEVKGYFRDGAARNKFEFFQKNYSAVLANQEYLISIGLVYLTKGPRHGQFDLPLELL
jgi:DNA-directed RNA polymerase subunit RPC12/RpoP